MFRKARVALALASLRRHVASPRYAVDSKEPRPARALRRLALHERAAVLRWVVFLAHASPREWSSGFARPLRAAHRGNYRARWDPCLRRWRAFRQAGANARERRRGNMETSR